MGLCLGAQLLTEAAGGTVYRCDPPEVGWFEVETGPEAAADPVMGALPPRFMAMQWHLYACELPAAATELARNAACVQALRIGEAAWGTQFHIETTREILVSWADMAPEELARFGYDRARYDAELDRYGAGPRGDRPRHGRALRRGRPAAAPVGLDRLPGRLALLRPGDVLISPQRQPRREGS